MNIRIDGSLAQVMLSDRNLETLVEMRKHPGEIIPMLVRRTENGYDLTIGVEADEIHYGDRERGMGPEDIRNRMEGIGA